MNPFRKKKTHFDFHPSASVQTDDLIRSGLSNKEITITFLEQQKILTSIIPTEQQLADRRYYLKTIIFKELEDDTQGGFYKWLKELEGNYKKPNNHIT